MCLDHRNRNKFPIYSDFCGLDTPDKRAPPTIMMRKADKKLVIENSYSCRTYNIGLGAAQLFSLAKRMYRYFFRKS